jgi:subtilase family serine protease
MTLQITARVGNIGLINSPAFVTELYNGNQPVGSINMDPLSPNTSWVFTWTLTVPKGKFYTFTATADPANRISEVGKNNNAKTLTVSTLPNRILSPDVQKSIPSLLGK